ncbi:hypothetical protein Gotur_031281 [Gossypium turneri]
MKKFREKKLKIQYDGFWSLIRSENELERTNFVCRLKISIHDDKLMRKIEDCVSRIFERDYYENYKLRIAIPMISKNAVGDYKINGYTIPTQSLLFVNIWAIGRDPKELPITLAALIQCFDWKLPNVNSGVDMSSFFAHKRLSQPNSQQIMDSTEFSLRQPRRTVEERTLKDE